jgi:hypothetical protein
MQQRQHAQFITNIHLLRFYLVTAVNPLQSKSLLGRAMPDWQVRRP